MDPISGFSLILGLISLWQRERDNSKEASKEEFYAFLTKHEFEKLHETISSVHGLEDQLERILQTNQEELHRRFDAVDENLMRILHSVEGFRDLAAIVAPKAVLSAQEESILVQFVESDCDMLFAFPCSGGYTVIQTENWDDIEVQNPRVIESSLYRLVRLEFLLYDGVTKKEKRYKLTEKAIAYVDNLRKEELSEQARKILRRLMTSKNLKLFYQLQSNKYFINDGSCTHDPSKEYYGEDDGLLQEDLDILVEKKYLKKPRALTPDEEVRYCITTAGKDYIRKVDEKK